jgi:hypothetical protein
MTLLIGRLFFLGTAFAQGNTLPTPSSNQAFNNGRQADPPSKSNDQFQLLPTQKREEQMQPPEIPDPFELTIQEQSELGTPTRRVRIELASVDGSIGYDVELVSIDRASRKRHKFKIKGSQLRARLTPGRYRVRARSYTSESVYGVWGNWKDFAISHKPPTNIYPAEGAVITPISDAKEKIVFQWPELPKTTAYLFEVRTEGGKTIEKKVVKNFSQTVELPINQKYNWSILPLTYEGEEKTIKDLTTYNSFQITNPHENTTSVIIKVSQDKADYKYEYELVRLTSDTEKTPPTVFESVIPEFRARLEPGEYEFRVRAVYKDETKSDWSSTTRFIVEFTSAAALSPKPNQIFVALHPKKHPVEISWLPFSKTKRYIVYIYNQDGDVIQKVNTEKTKTSVSVPPGSRYYYHVQAHLPNAEERKPPPIGKRTVAFEVEKYGYHDLSEAEEPKNIYGWVSWIGSAVRYESKNFDNNSLTKNNLFGGTGQAAIGYWDRPSRLGLLGFAELSGFTIGQKKYLYQTFGLQIGKRFIFEEGARARVWLGWAAKNLPELITRPLTDFLEVRPITAQGLVLQGNYLRPWFGDYSLFFSANYFQDFGQNETPNGLKMEHLQGGTVGAYISKPFGTEYRGRLGYSYRFDSSSYTSTEDGNVNQVDISGHYISVIFEFAIAEPD